MTDPRSTSSPARFGLTDPRAEEILYAGGWWRAGPVEGAELVLGALSRSPDPDLALQSLNRLREATVGQWPEVTEALKIDGGFRGRLIAVLGASTTLGDFLCANPGEWRRLLSPAPPDSDYTGHLLRAVEDGAGEVRMLRRAYRGLLLDIAAADLGHLVQPEIAELGYEQVAEQLSDLAVAALRASLALAAKQVGKPSRLAVIAMGKCGGRELNYVSDVDVVFVADNDDDLPTATRLASTMMRLASEACFEVDAALRPEGKAGALVRTLDGHISYYKRWARTWEFQALLKARPVAGDAEVGRQYVKALAPMVWTAADRENFVVDVQAMRRRVEEHLPKGLAERELKLGRGGLRDVEFAVQLLQLVHGRSDEALRSPTTMAALAALGSAAMSAGPTLPVWRSRTASCVPWSTGSNCRGCAVRTPFPLTMIGPVCAGWRDRRDFTRTAAGRRPTCCWPSSGGTATGFGACTRSCSIGRCWRPSRGCRPRRCG